MYKYIKHNNEKYPIRVSNTVLGEWQEETGKTEMKNMNFRDMRILLEHSLKAGHRFAKKEYKLEDTDIELMVDDQSTVKQFLELIPGFFNATTKEAAGGVTGNPQVPNPKKT